VRRKAEDTSVNRKNWERRTSQFHVGDHSGVMDGDRLVTEATCAFLQSRRADDPPFFALVGHLAPHFPLIVPQAYYDRYAGRVPMPDLPADYLWRLPANYRHLIMGFGVDNVDRALARRGRELYWAFVNWFDDEVGKILAALESSAVAENTVVIYTTDHGENKGDHGMWWKNNMYEHSARIPLIVSWPARWAGGQRRTEACSLVDVVQTIAELGDAPLLGDWDGDSMVNWLDDATTPWKDIAVSEYYAHNIASGFAMLRHGAFKYVYHTRMDEAHGPERELYNLDRDPGEWENMAGDSAQSRRMAEMHSLLVEELGREPEETERICRADYARGYSRRDGPGNGC
jgi:choline-sulfatase